MILTPQPRVMFVCLVTIALALSACKSPKPDTKPEAKPDPEVKTRAMTGSLVERHDCAARADACILLGERAVSTSSVLLSKEEAYALYSELCGVGDIMGCYMQYVVVSAELTLEQFSELETSAYERILGDDVDLKAEAVRLSEMIAERGEGSCERGEARTCQAVSMVKISETIRLMEPEELTESEALRAHFKHVDKLCLSEQPDAVYACVASEHWHTLNDLDKETTNGAAFTERVESMYTKECKEGDPVESYVTCAYLAMRHEEEGLPAELARHIDEQLHVACAQEKDLLACAEYVDRRKKEVFIDEAMIEYKRTLVLQVIGGEELPEDLSGVPEDKRALVQEDFDALTDRKAGLAQRKVAYRAAHKPGCEILRDAQICRAWREACEGLDNAPECDGAK